jgi:lipopolysaccharide export system permease protein
MMSTIDRYLIRHLVVFYGICLASILGVFMVVDVLSNLDRLLSQGSMLSALGDYLLATVPIAYYQIAPGTFLMAAMFTLSTLNKNNELLALKASGVSIYRILQPVIAASLVAVVIMAAVQEVVIPAESDNIRKVGQDKPITSVVLADAEGDLFRIARYFPYDKRMEEVVVTMFHENGAKHLSIHAGAAVYDEKEEEWILQDVRRYEHVEHDKHGTLMIAVDKKTGQRLPYVGMPEMRFPTDIVPSDIESVDRDVNYLTFSQLNSQYRRQKYLPHLRVKLHSRIASPLASFVLLLLGVPFALRTGRKAILLNVAVCIAVASAFFVVSFFFADMGADGRISPIAAAWLPVVMFTSLGLGLVETIRT